ncbi:pyridoxamine 5'-phosphate oxidase [Fulvivirga sp. M361]|uniref:pyridoxamine 5'-phosphate oxidase n=1 Tax=Fulvivirga sp. M361 TaxID=2594266 RepID=UPI00117BCF0D|nr:pyridoxamine 5'-phosphate oxidase [Fulvivirga sp. M361]TRX60896.1 pyridoxamine 5'-phosphate oxidase [Fulvivirga sp. M361]
MPDPIADIRKDYTQHSLDVSDVNNDPVKQFEQWFNEALKAEVLEANAMNLATVSEKGVPSSRIVLLKGVEDDGFVFYTNYQSDKGKDIEANPVTALTFFWPELERQVRIQGHTEKVSSEKSTAYFQSRPRGSQIGAWTSPQSTIIENRKLLEEREKKISEKFKGTDVLPRPKQWGGYSVKPHLVEFWQGRASRLHDRIIYTWNNDHWVINRLAP